MRQALDKLLSSWISKKLLVFIIACFGCFYYKVISGEDWVNIAMMYVATQGAIDLFKTMRKDG